MIYFLFSLIALSLAGLIYIYLLRGKDKKEMDEREEKNVKEHASFVKDIELNRRKIIRIETQVKVLEDEE